MPSRFAKVIIGAFVILTTLILFVPVFFPGETETGTPREISEIKREIEQTKVDKALNDLATNQDTTQNQEVANDPIIDSYNTLSQLDEPQGYGDLLEEEGAQAPAEFDGQGRGGLDVGFEGRVDSFPENPTVMGDTPADVAKNLKEQERNRTIVQEVASPKRTKLEEDREPNEVVVSRKEVRKEVAKDVVKEVTPPQKKETLEVANDAREVKELKEVSKVSTAKKPQPLSGKVRSLRDESKPQVKKLAQSSLPSGRYLQVGVFSTSSNAGRCKENLKRAKIAASRADVAKGFGIHIQYDANRYYVLVGPLTSAGVSRIKPKVDSALRVNSSVVTR